MTAKELAGHLERAAPNEDVLLLVEDEWGARSTYEVATVRHVVDMDHEGTRHVTLLVAGEQMVED